MEQINPNHLGRANFKARTVKDIIEPAKSISNKGVPGLPGDRIYMKPALGRKKVVPLAIAVLVA